MSRPTYEYVALAMLVVGLFVSMNLLQDRYTGAARASSADKLAPPTFQEDQPYHLERQSNSDNIIDWDDRFRFVPNNVQNCTNLFGGVTDLPDRFVKKFKKFEAHFEAITKELPGHTEGYTSKYGNAFKTYLELASHKSVGSICETGFNGGHSTFGWLTINRLAHVYTFDIGVHNYAQPMASHIHNLHPGRWNITWGDSTKTIPEFRRNNPSIKCDLIIIDGGHTTHICKSDLENFKEMASSDNVIIMDNYPQDSWNFKETLGNCWEWAKRNARVFEIFNCNMQVPKMPDFGFSVGRFPVE